MPAFVPWWRRSTRTTFGRIRPALLWMQAGAFALLLIGAVNLTNLLLIRASGRVKEIAVRQALGASRWHVVSEVIVETTLLTLAGGAAGARSRGGRNPPAERAGCRSFTLGEPTSPSTPGWHGRGSGGRRSWDSRSRCRSRGSICAAISTSAIQSETRGGTSSRAAQRLRHGFIVAQIALALVLLSGAGLLGLSLEQAMAVSPGFRPDHVLTGQISVPWNKYPNWPARLAFNERLLKDLSRQPGVSAAGVVNNVPLSGNSGKSAATVKGHVRRPGESARGHYSYGVDGDYFTAMGFSLAGRTFPHRGRFAPVRAGLRGGRRLRAVLLAARQRSWANAFSRVGEAATMPKHSPWSASWVR